MARLRPYIYIRVYIFTWDWLCYTWVQVFWFRNLFFSFALFFLVLGSLLFFFSLDSVLSSFAFPSYFLLLPSSTLCSSFFFLLFPSFLRFTLHLLVRVDLYNFALLVLFFATSFSYFLYLQNLIFLILGSFLSSVLVVLLETIAHRWSSVLFAPFTQVFFPFFFFCYFSFRSPLVYGALFIYMYRYDSSEHHQIIGVQAHHRHQFQHGDI